jgi:hypothetical protein
METETQRSPFSLLNVSSRLKVSIGCVSVVLALGETAGV